MVIDGHTHVWPDAIAARALGNPSPELRRFGDGTVAGLRAAMRTAGIDRAACLAVADTPERLEVANAFVASLDRALFIPVGTVHPARSVDENLASLREIGVRAVKIHPLFQRYALDDQRLSLILEALAGEFVAIIHVGAGGAHQSGELCTPEMLRNIALRFPELEIIACHLGGYRELDAAEQFVVGLPVYLDTSWAPGLATLDRRRIRSLIKRHDPYRVVFASDWPMADPSAEIDAVQALRLPAPEMEAILGGTLSALLGVRP